MTASGNCDYQRRGVALFRAEWLTAGHHDFRAKRDWERRSQHHLSELEQRLFWCDIYSRLRRGDDSQLQLVSSASPITAGTCSFECLFRAPLQSASSQRLRSDNCNWTYDVTVIADVTVTVTVTNSNAVFIILITYVHVKSIHTHFVVMHIQHGNENVINDSLGVMDVCNSTW